MDLNTTSNNTGENNFLGSPPPSSNSGFFGNFNTTTWILISIIGIFLIFNLITFLSPGIQKMTLGMDTIAKKIFNVFSLIFGKVIYGTAEVTKDVVGGTANVIDTGLTDVQKMVEPNDNSSSLSSQSIQTPSPQPSQTQQNSLSNTINPPPSQTSAQSDYEASLATSTINSTGKTGWCYVGEDMGVRSCAQVAENQQCMSGDIFPTNELCINPNLRQ